MSNRTPVVISSVHPLEGHEGTIVTIKGSGFASHGRSNCVVVGGMGACARAEHVTASELTVRVGPVAKATHGDLLMWPGTLAELHTDSVRLGDSSLTFSETTLFRNGAPVASAAIDFKLTKASPHTYGGHVVEQIGNARVDLGGHEAGEVMRVSFPKDFSHAKHKKVDVCMVLKEPTLALDFTAEISGRGEDEQCLRAIAKSITVHAGHIGERVFADVVRNPQSGGLDLYVKKPHLSNGMVTLHFS